MRKFREDGENENDRRRNGNRNLYSRMKANGNLKKKNNPFLYLNCAY